jgi:hypothetical protein
MGKLTCMQFTTTFYIGGRYDICQLLDIYGVNDVGQIEILYIQLNHQYLSLVLLWLWWLLESWRGINPQVVIKLQHNCWSKQGVKHNIFISTKLLLKFQIRKNCCSNAKSLILYTFIKSAIKLITNYQEILLLWNTYKILSNTFLTKWCPHINEITGDHE